MVLPSQVSLSLPERFSKQFPLLFKWTFFSKVRRFTKNIVKLLLAALPGRAALPRCSAEAQIPWPRGRSGREGLGLGSQCCCMPSDGLLGSSSKGNSMFGMPVVHYSCGKAFTCLHCVRPAGPGRDGACGMNAWRCLSRPDSLLAASLKCYFAAVLVRGMQVALAELPGQVKEACPKILSAV